MDRNITIDKNGIHADNTEKNTLVINGARYCSEDTILLEWERDYDDRPNYNIDDTRVKMEDTSNNWIKRIRRNSEGAIYLESLYTEEVEDDTLYTRKDYHLCLPTSPEQLYKELLKEEQHFLDNENSNGEERSYENVHTYVHYLDEHGTWLHTDELPSMDLFMLARENDDAQFVGYSKGASPTDSAVIVDLFTNDAEAKGVQNWFYYNRAPYTNDTH